MLEVLRPRVWRWSAGGRTFSLETLGGKMVLKIDGESRISASQESWGDLLRMAPQAAREIASITSRYIGMIDPTIGGEASFARLLRRYGINGHIVISSGIGPMIMRDVFDWAGSDADMEDALADELPLALHTRVVDRLEAKAGLYLPGQKERVLAERDRLASLSGEALPHDIFVVGKAESAGGTWTFLVLDADGNEVAMEHGRSVLSDESDVCAVGLEAALKWCLCHRFSTIFVSDPFVEDAYHGAVDDYFRSGAKRSEAQLQELLRTWRRIRLLASVGPGLVRSAVHPQAKRALGHARRFAV